MFGMRRSVAVAIVAVVAVLASTATAYAYWTVNGSGTGTATVAETKPLVITQVAVTGLLPGKVQHLDGTVNNPNDFDVNIAQHVFTVTAEVDEPHGGCVVSQNFVLTPPTDHDVVVPADGAVSFSGGSIKLRDLLSVDQANCQGAVITLSYTLAPQ